jgi:hypothetical protein
MDNDKKFVKILSLTWDNALILLDLPGLSEVKVVSLKPDIGIIARTTEFVNVGRIHLECLLPNTEYELLVEFGDGEHSKLCFKTLKKPVGELLSSFAVVADPHISLKPENRKGRLFVESPLILSGLVEDINTRNVDFTLIAGDLTNMGLSDEYAVIANILKKLDAPLLTVPGDHDVKDSSHVELWRHYFGKLQWEMSLAGYGIVGLNSANNVLDADGAAILKRCLKNENLFPIIISHLQIIENPQINIGSKQKTISTMSETSEILGLLKRRRAIFYAGHQNIPARINIGSSIQVNVPQTLQYICGYYWVRRYENGFYHSLIPIKSDILQHYSRRTANLAAITYSEMQWDEDYRNGVENPDFLF